MKINALFITNHKDKQPIMIYQLTDEPYLVDVHVQVIDIPLNETHTINIQVTNANSGQLILKADKQFALKDATNNPTHKGLAEMSLPFQFEDEDLQGANTLLFQVTIEKSSQEVELSLERGQRG